MRHADLRCGETLRITAFPRNASHHCRSLCFHLLKHGRFSGVSPAAPLTKVTRCKDLGATVMLEGNHIGAARERAMELVAEDELLSYINGYDDPDIIAGAGTMALEMLDQCPGLEAVVCPVGGGGLI